jgi:hypothetical protein
MRRYSCCDKPNIVGMHETHIQFHRQIQIPITTNFGLTTHTFGHGQQNGDHMVLIDLPYCDSSARKDTEWIGDHFETRGIQKTLPAWGSSAHTLLLSRRYKQKFSLSIRAVTLKQHVTNNRQSNQIIHLQIRCRVHRVKRNVCASNQSAVSHTASQGSPASSSSTTPMLLCSKAFTTFRPND